MIRLVSPITVMFVCVLLVLAGCKTDSTGSGSGGSTTCSNAAGTWNTTEIINGAACGTGTYTEQHSYAVTQSGCAITVSSGGQMLSGNVNGNTISWVGSYPTSGGYVTITSLSVTMNGDSLSGNAQWNFSNTAGGPTICSGSTQIRGYRP